MTHHTTMFEVGNKERRAVGLPRWRTVIVVGALALLSAAGVGQAGMALLDGRRGGGDDRGEDALRWLEPYRPTYVLPLAYTPEPNNSTLEGANGNVPDNAEWDRAEVKFQFSFALPVWKDIPHMDADLYFAYTQVAFWQLYNSELSEPFRDTNYEPEAFLLFDTDFSVFGLDNKALMVGFLHQSNGRAYNDVTRTP